LSVLAFFCASLQAQESEVARLGALTKSYTETVAAMDYEAEAAFYDEASVFEDPTSGEFRPAWHFEGGAAIVSFFRGINEDFGTLAIANEIERLLVTPPSVIAFVKSTVTTCATRSATNEVLHRNDRHGDGSSLRRKQGQAPDRLGRLPGSPEGPRDDREGPGRSKGRSTVRSPSERLSEAFAGLASIPSTPGAVAQRRCDDGRTDHQRHFYLSRPLRR